MSSVNDKITEACPFCGSVKVRVWTYNKPCVVCETCWSGGPAATRVVGPENCEEAWLEAVQLWNKRAGVKQPASVEMQGAKAVCSKELLSVAIVELISRRGKAELQAREDDKEWRENAAAQWRARAAGLGEAIQVLQLMADAATDNDPDQRPAR